MTNYGKNYSFGATNLFKWNFCRSERLFGAVLGISQNLRSRGQRPSSPHDQIWAKLQFWILNFIQCTRWHFFVNGKNFTGTVLSIAENLRVISEGHHMTKYGRKRSFGATLYFKAPGTNSVYAKHLLEKC